MTRSLAELSAAGYLPVGVDLAVSTVMLDPIAARDFSETWYDETARANLAGPTVTVPVRVFLDQCADLVPASPLRLIGHVSRCGSTLLSNLLALRPRTMVLKEPDFVTDVAHWITASAHPADRQQYADLLAGLLTYTCHAANMNDRTSVVKVTSWTTPVVMASLARHVDTKWLLQWREAHDVVASNLATPPGWGDISERGGAARRAMGLCPSLTDGVDLYASVWAKVIAAFADAPDVVQYRALGYHEFASDKEECLLAAEAWFDIVGGERPPGYAEESARYSKGGLGERYDGAGSHRRPELDATARRRVEELTSASSAWLHTSARRLV